METELNPNINKKETKLDFKESKYATGRRKKSIARVWLKRFGQYLCKRKKNDRLF